jgi:hypothetical protein
MLTGSEQAGFAGGEIAGRPVVAGPPQPYRAAAPAGDRSRPAADRPGRRFRHRAAMAGLVRLPAGQLRASLAGWSGGCFVRGRRPDGTFPLRLTGVRRA